MAKLWDAYDKNFKTKYIKSQYSFNLLFRQKRECIGVFKQCY